MPTLIHTRNTQSRILSTIEMTIKCSKRKWNQRKTCWTAITSFRLPILSSTIESIDTIETLTLREVF